MLKCFCDERQRSQWNLMPMALERFGNIAPVVRPWALLLSVTRGVVGWGCPISSRVTRSGMASR
eukprot:14563033-Ditylum_brightwellii.AAC.1